MLALGVKVRVKVEAVMSMTPADLARETRRSWMWSRSGSSIVGGEGVRDA